MKPKLIKNAREYRMALRRIERLMDARRGTSQGDELELLATLVELYEDEHAPVLPPDPVEAIRFRMEQSGMEAKDLVPFIGARSRVSEVLHRRRALTLNMIRRLHHGLGIPAELLLGEAEAAS
jgi:HTH-type transcriptional regulator/antitoxin HigA